MKDQVNNNKIKNLNLLFKLYNILGINGVAEIKAHPFFFGIDWKNIRNKKPPFIPDVINLFIIFVKYFLIL